MTNLNPAYYYVCVLVSDKDGKFYVGFTQNLSLRFEQHQSGKVTSTKYRRPFRLIYFEGCICKEDAVKRERYLKTHYGKMFLGNRLKSYFTTEDKKSIENE